MRKIRWIFIAVILIVFCLAAGLGAGHIIGMPIIFLIIFFMNVARKIRAEKEDREEFSRRRNETAGNASDAEERTTQESSYVGTIITCDYCGSRVDTEKHTCCDHCGGPYGDDEEWKEIQRRRRGTRL